MLPGIVTSVSSVKPAKEEAGRLVTVLPKTIARPFPLELARIVGQFLMPLALIVTVNNILLLLPELE